MCPYTSFILCIIGEDDEEEENNDLITDSWENEVIVDGTGNMDTDSNDAEADLAVTKQKIAETVQKGRSLIKLIRRSQILTSFVNDDKKNYDVKLRLALDCLSRWNSIYSSLKSLVEHKPTIINLFENKRTLPITKKQKDKIFGLELTSDDWNLFSYLLEIFEPFYEVTRELSGSKYPTIGLALYMIRSLKDFFDEKNDEDPSIVVALKKFSVDSLNHYFNEQDQQFELLMASSFVFL